MLGPFFIALAAPVTLAVIALASRRGFVVRLLHARPLRALAHPVTAAILAVGSMYALYLTPLYAATRTRPQLHDALHAHLLVAGCLFAWSVIGRDAMPNRPSLALRGWVLFAALSAHAVLAKLLYAFGPPVGGVQPSAGGDWRRGAELMWYGGDFVDVLLIVALFAEWYARGLRRDRQRRRAALPMIRCGRRVNGARSSENGRAYSPRCLFESNGNQI
jgi:putative membrane protein